VSGNIHIQFTVLGSNIFLKTVSKIDWLFMYNSEK
jgi:hypothetical protein